MPLTDNGLELLAPEECLALLTQGSLGRVAVTIAALPAIFPVNYAVLGGAIIFRTGEGTKLRAAADRAVVAFEVDEFDLESHTGWSVLAVGMATEILVPEEIAAVGALQLEPLAGGDRPNFVRIQPEFVSGRRLVPRKLTQDVHAVPRSEGNRTWRPGRRRRPDRDPDHPAVVDEGQSPDGVLVEDRDGVAEIGVIPVPTSVP